MTISRYLLHIRHLSNAADRNLGFLRYLETMVYFISLKMNPFNMNQSLLEVRPPDFYRTFEELPSFILVYNMYLNVMKLKDSNWVYQIHEMGRSLSRRVLLFSPTQNVAATEKTACKKRNGYRFEIFCFLLDISKLSRISVINQYFHECISWFISDSTYLSIILPKCMYVDLNWVSTDKNVQMLWNLRFTKLLLTQRRSFDFTKSTLT
jgi:hypothetical protein